MEEKETQNIYFFRKGRKICFYLEENLYELNNTTQEILQKKATLPLKSIFNNIPLKKIERIIEILSIKY